VCVLPCRIAPLGCGFSRRALDITRAGESHPSACSALRFLSCSDIRLGRHHRPKSVPPGPQQPCVQILARCINKELNRLVELSTWDLVPICSLPARPNLLHSNFVFAHKRNKCDEVENSEARLVVDGNTQKSDLLSWRSVARATNENHPTICSRTTAQSLKTYSLAALGGLPIGLAQKLLVDRWPWANMGHFSARSRRFGADWRSFSHTQVLVITVEGHKGPTPMDASTTAIVASHGVRH